MTVLLPTLPGKVNGIVCDAPWTLQCQECGQTVTNATMPERLRSTGRDSISYLVIQSGYHFHSCEGRNGIRRCPSCLAAARAACPNIRCKD
jgi:hypothetical protein